MSASTSPKKQPQAGVYGSAVLGEEKQPEPVSGHPDAPQRPCAACPWSPVSDLTDLFPDLSDLEGQLAAIDLDLDALLGPDLDLDELLGPDLDLDSLLGEGGDQIL